MSKVTVLRGIAWDHPRGYEPLYAVSKEFEKAHPEVTITWDKRSLKEFGDTPIEELADEFDLITIDHPYMGQAHANKLLLQLQDKLSANILQELERQSVGPSFKSYFYHGELFALPIDAAALVAASRSDLISGLKLALPNTRKELLDFYKKVSHAHAIAWPLCATDLWCTFMTLCAQDAGRNFIKDRVFDEKTGSAVLNELKVHLEYLHPESLNWNPIQVLDRMASGDDIIYSPFLFGYTNYSREGYDKNIVHSSNSPINPIHDVSTILGGVGLSISAKCEHADLAVSFISYAAKAETQEGIYTKNGGQPGNLVAWESEANNRFCHKFFNNTMQTMKKAYVRPQHAGWNKFQENGAALLHNGLVKNMPAPTIMKNLNELYKSID